MPVHNGEPYLGAAIESILRQSFADFELLIIDDGSTDHSYEIARTYADPRIRLLRNPQNLRLIATLNRGLEEARGKYVARMDADDISLPQRLQAQVAFLDRHAEVGALGSAVQVIGADGGPDVQVRFPDSHVLIRWALLFASPIAHPAVMMRKALVKRLGGYRAHAVHCEDYDLWWRAIGETRLANLDDVLLQLRKHEGNITVRHAALHGDTALQVCQAMLSQALRADISRALIAGARQESPAAEELVPHIVELLFRYHRFCLSADSATAGEELALRRDLKRRISRVLDTLDARTETAWSRLRRVGRRARLARTGSMSAANLRLVRNAAFLAGARILFRALT